MMVTVVIGDLVHSKSIQDRSAFQRSFQKSIKNLPKGPGILSPYTLSAGDEVEAVYHDPSHLFRDFWALAIAIYPKQIRFSVGMGSLTTAVDENNPLVMDGPAFHVARRGIEKLKKNRELAGISAEPPIDVSLEDKAAQLLARHVRPWKSSRWHILQQTLLGYSPAYIAKTLCTSLTAVYKNLSVGGVGLVIALGDDIGSSLARKAGESSQ